jgi:HAAS domain-containing protein
MNLIDRYIAEVGKHLPRKNRADIEAEIRSTLEDMLDERKQGDGPADEAIVMQLLKEYGSPREVAATYGTHQHQYLIGPRLFPIFERVVRIVLAIFIGASLIGLGVGLAETGWTGPAFVSTLGEWAGGLFSGLIAAFGNIVLVFAIIERTQAAKEFEKEFAKESKDWDPKELQQEPDPDRIDMADHIATVIFTVLGLVVLNLYPNLFAIRSLSDGTWTTIPILTEAFFRFLPWINIMGLIQIVFSGFMLGQRNWAPATRILGILIDVAQMILAVLILRTPGIFGITPEALNAIGIAEEAENLSRLFNSLPALIILIVVLATAVKVIKSLLRLFSNKSRSPYPVLK